MAIRFDAPYLLLLLIPAGAFVYFTTRNMVRLAKWRRCIVITLRSLVFLLLILLLSGFSLRQMSNTATTLFLADSSDSVIQKEEAVDFIREALKGMGRRDEAGIINFGESTSVELLPDKNPMFSGMQSRINTTFTNIEKALLMAQSLIPWDHQKRVVLITDGRENTGDSLRQVKQMKGKGYAIDVYSVSSVIDEEVQVQELKVPDSVHLNEQFEIAVMVKSSAAAKATLLLYSNRRLTAQKEVMLEKGTNRFAFSDKAVNGGTVTYRVEVLADTDTVVQNNSLSSFTFAKDVPEVLVIREYDEASQELEKILGNDFGITAINPKQVPVELKEMLKYDAFILTNVSAESLESKFLENLETVVSHQGKGLLVTGGDNSYGPGGYYKTPLEKILPVNMDIKPKEEEPNLALILVIDKSGSMSSGDYGIPKMEMAREAAIRATEVLGEDDIIGVIAFDDALKWVVQPQLMDDVRLVQDAIGTIRAGGGTQILPPLEEAYNAIQEQDAKLKHIILLTDGQAEKQGYEPVIEGLRDKGITLSTVAVGRGADHLLMNALAYGGQGRYYETDEFSNIPNIFTKEVFLAGKKYLTNRTFVPQLAAYSDILSGIEAVPVLDGYVATTAKNTAETIFASDEQEPVLAAWQYGLGRTVAWTPDVQGVWTYDWMSWANSPRFWKNIVSWIIQQDMSKGYSVETKTEGPKGIITVKAEDDAFMTAGEIKGELVGPGGEKQEITLFPSAPGEYEGSFDSSGSGTYIADITMKGADGREERISTGLVIPYSPEYDILSSNDGYLLQKLVYEGGGRIIENPGEVFKGELPPVIGMIDLSMPLMIALFFLLMADVILRRLNISKEAYASGSRIVARMKAVKGSYIQKQSQKRMGEGSLKSESIAPQELGTGQKTVKQPAKKEQQVTGSYISELLEKKKKWKR
jgi:Mg-chelatase subunit ChlD